MSYASKTMSKVATSTTAAEYGILFICAEEIIALRNLLEEMGYKQTAPTKIYCDCDPAIKLADGPGKLSHRTKAMDLKMHKLREYITDELIELIWVSTNNNPADIGTKPLPGPPFMKHRARMTVKYPLS